MSESRDLARLVAKRMLRWEAQSPMPLDRAGREYHSVAVPACRDDLTGRGYFATVNGWEHGTSIPPGKVGVVIDGDPLVHVFSAREIVSELRREQVQRALF